MAKKKSTKKSVKKATAKSSKSRCSLFAACLFIGVGVGILLDKVAAFTLIGMGVGWLLTWHYSCK